MTEPKILMVRFGAIGNALAAVPAIRAIRTAWPQARLALVGDPLTLELLGPCPYLNELIRYHSNGPEAAGPGYARFIAELRHGRFTHVVHFKRHLRSELIGLLSGAPARIGFRTEARVQLLTHKVPYDEGVNVIELNLRLARALGVEARDRRLEYWPTSGSARVEAALSQTSGSGPLVVIHPAGSTQRERLWGGFGDLAELLRQQLDARVVLIGAGPEREIIEAAARQMTTPPALAIGLPLPELGELIARADLFAGTDSGPAHIADAVGTAGAILYAPHPGLAAQIAKWKPEGERYLAFTPPNDCLDCPERPCSGDRPKQCAGAIPAEQVANGLIALYDKSAHETGK